ncbi:MAG: hypothetical protein QOH95_746, partial [Gaiellaceae bacterium]|nr:hypothetical protein [Gaiellaceae bacterium]
ANALAHLGRSESGEAEVQSVAQMDYENRAYPLDAIDYSQTLGAISAGKRVHGHGSKSPKRWEQVGDGTMNVDVLGTQSFLRGTQWSGRISAIAVDYKHCDTSSCSLYIGAAGGGVWKTDDALAPTPHWKEMNDGLDSLSIGSLIIDPTDSSGKTLYVGTGEPNGASENEAGLGLYKSTNRGRDWSPVSGSVAVSKDRGIGAISVDPTNPNHLFIGTDVARHGASSTFGGRFTPPGAPPVGLYESKDGGQTFTAALTRPSDVPNPATANGSDFFKGGITDLEWDPNNAGTFYVTMFDYGVFRGTVTPAGAVFTQIYTAVPDPAGLGIRYQLSVADLGNGKTRIYLGEGSNEVVVKGALVDASKFYRTDDAATTTSNAGWTLLSSNVDGTPGFSSFDYCRTQCSYDMPVASPPGKPDEVWIGGATQYQELPTRTLRYRSNGRAVMRSTDGGVQFKDQTGDARHEWESIHPDIHEFAFAPGGVAFIGSDGGLTRTSGNYVDFSSDCDNRNNLQSRPVSYQDCKTWLSSIPERLLTLNAGLPTLQLQDVAVDPTDPFNDLITGTQDNGSPFWDGNVWGMNVQGDGAPPAIDKDGVIHYHQYSGEGIDVNFNGTQSGQWIWIGDPLLFSPEGAAIFYGPLIADPVVGQSAFAGLQHIWRTKDAGNADKQFLADHCNTNTGDKAGTGPASGCGDWTPLGGAAGDLTAGPDADKGNGPAGFVSAEARAPSDTSTLWAATRRGRLWISKNIDAADPAAVKFTRLDTPAQPRRFPSGISVDANDPNHAIVSFSGFAAYTPGQPGHVFDVKFNPVTGTATWTDLTADLGDQPVLDVALDTPTGDIYAATDFGVDRLIRGTGTWITAADNLPKTAVYALTLSPGKHTGDRLLYAATHGRGAWRAELPDVKQKDDDRDKDKGRK